MTHQLFPIDAPFSILPDTEGDQRNPRAAKLADGGAIVVFDQSFRPDPEVNSFDYEIVAQRFDSSGAPVGGLQVITRVEDRTGIGLREPVVTGLADGGYAVAWAGFSPDGTGRDDAHINTYDADGTLVNAAISVLPQRVVTNALTGLDVQVQPLADPGTLELAALDNGGFALAWNGTYRGELNQFAGARSAFTQTFDAEGAAIAPPVRLMPWEATVSFAQDRMDWVENAAPLADGHYVVVFRGGSNHPDNPADAPGILARIMDGTGTPVTDAFLVNEQLEFRKANPTVGTLEDGSFVVAWADAGNFGPGSDSFWRRFDADGTPQTGEQPLEARFTGQDVIPMQDGGFMLALTNVPGTGQPLRNTSALRFDAEGNPAGDITLMARAREDLDAAFLRNQVSVVSLEDGPLLSVYSTSLMDVSDIKVLPFMPDIVGSSGDDELTAYTMGTALYGLDGDDTLIGGPGDDWLDGGEGENTVVYNGALADYAFRMGEDGMVVASDLRDAEETEDFDGTDMLVNIQMVAFADETAPLGDILLRDIAIAPQDATGEMLDGITASFTAAGQPTMALEQKADGMLAFSLMEREAGTVRIARDYDAVRDGGITAADALDALRIAVGLDPSFGPAQAQNFIAADINGDGQVTAGDALDILRVAVGLEAEHAPRWAFFDAKTDWANAVQGGQITVGEGIEVAAFSGDLDLAMTGILIGNLTEVV